ncbi:GPP34 family phosphoprotein [Streptomyces sp. NRRL B-24085]|uniref:GPP34 family phosphoprotein n=1 Tax=Streptomyces sp. NRRL B-24085 TaxID=1709476 RepID=UPI0006B31454|nr:GPP34 family phosphoprotein [Streptomyces sp. NRRL B-24085]
MTTARDLTLVVLGLPAERPVAQGDLSLALAGAEAVDLLGSGALTLDGDRMLPGPPAPTGDRLLDEASASLSRREPYDTVAEWLWRRGAELAASYAVDLERDGLVVHPRGHFGFRSAHTVLVDSPARRAAEERRAAGEPVLVALLAAAGIEAEPDETAETLTGDAVTAVLAAVGDAVAQLEAIRLRRDVENAAFDNVWRA